MKIVILTLIDFYRMVLSPFIKATAFYPSACRQNPSCSEYAKTAIKTNGVLKGSHLSLKRILNCHPYA